VAQQSGVNSRIHDFNRVFAGLTEDMRKTLDDLATRDVANLALIRDGGQVNLLEVIPAALYNEQGLTPAGELFLREWLRIRPSAR
jgi:hypothetical protein